MNKKIIIFLLVIFISCFFSKTVLATDVIDLQQNSSGGGYLFTEGYKFAQSFKPQHDNISKISVAIYTATAQTYTLSLYNGIYDYGQLLVASSTYSAGNGVIDFDLSLPVGVSAGGDYYITIEGATAFKPNGVGGNPYTDGQAYPSDAGVDDLYFVIYYDDDYIPWNIFWNIDVLVPDPNWIYTQNSGSIVFKYNNLGGVYESAWFYVERLDAKNGTAVMSMISPHIDIASSSSQQITGAPFDYPNGYYRLNQARFNGGANNYLQFPIDFQVVGTSTDNSILHNASTSLGEIISQVEETICADIDTTTITGALICALKRASLFVFKPSDSSMSALYGSFLDIKEKFPFNAFFGITDAFNSQISTSTASSTFRIPFINKTGNITTLNVMSSTSLSNLIGTSNNNIFRNSVIYFGWIICAFIIYITVRKI